MLQAGIEQPERAEQAPLPPPRATDSASASATPRAPGEDGTGTRKGRARDPYLDNAKYLTIVLVAVGHFWAPLTESSRSTSALYYLLYTFHMPTFIVISGYLSRSFAYRPRQLKRLVTGVLVPYLVFQTVLTFFIREFGTHPNRQFNYQEPEFALWFLLALCLWRLTTPVWKTLRWPLPVAVAIAVAASVTPSISDDLDLMRVAQFLPFFVLGLLLRPEHFELVRRRSVRLVAIPVSIGALAVSYASVPYISAAPFLHSKAAADLDLPSWLGALMTLAAFGCALVMTVCFLAWVPARRVWFTSLGAGTLGAYLLHVYPVKYAKYADWFEEEWVRHPLGRVALTVLAAVLMTLLCTAPVRKALRVVLEPRMPWMFTAEANGTAAAPLATPAPLTSDAAAKAAATGRAEGAVPAGVPVQSEAAGEQPSAPERPGEARAGARTRAPGSDGTGGTGATGDDSP
jgi:fucose 4-O-acetylase-like acetyltransferase